MAGDPAYAYYRVERSSSDEPATPGRTVKNVVVWMARNIPAGGTPDGKMAVDPEAAVATKDVVHILDREGRIVATRPFDYRSNADDYERIVTDDLLHLDVEAFRVRYELSDALPDAPASDSPPGGPGGRRKDDVDWGEFGQR